MIKLYFEHPHTVKFIQKLYVNCMTKKNKPSQLSMKNSLKKFMYFKHRGVNMQLQLLLSSLLLYIYISACSSILTVYGEIISD